MCYTDIFLGKKGLCVKLGFVCVTTIDPIKFETGLLTMPNIQYTKTVAR